MLQYRKKGNMEIGNLRLRLNKVGSDIPIVDATPAEAQVLHILHQGNNGGSSFGDKMDSYEVKGEAKSADGKTARTDIEEFRRLNAKYGRCVNKKGDKIIKLIWPESNPKLPQKFSDLKWAEIQYDGTDVAAVNLATGAPVVANPPVK